MSQTDSVLVSPPKAKSALKSTTSSKLVPTKPLPTRRMAYAKQLEVLRAYPAACGQTPRAVGNPEIAKLVDLAPDTVSFANPFFAAIGLLDRSENGYTPCAELMALYHAYQWEPDKAFHKLAPVFEKTWFGEALIPKLRFRTLAEEEAISLLAEVSSSGRDCKGQLRMLLDYLVIAGIIERDNGTIRLIKGSPAQDQSANGQNMVERNGHLSAEQNGAIKPSGDVATSFISKGNDGAIQLNVSFSIDAKEMGQWDPQRITAFMKGLADVLAAKGAIEKKESVQE